MTTKFFISLILLLNILFISKSNSISKYLNEGEILFNKKNYEESKFFFQKDIVFNPQSEKSYLYLSKIFKIEGDEKQEEHNLKTTLLLNPKNEEAIYLLINLKIKQSDFNEAENLNSQFSQVCSEFCFKQEEINKKLEDLLSKKNKQ